MPIDLMSLVEGGAQTPGKRPSGSGKLFANKELMAQFENKAEPEKPPEPLRTTSKKWTPPPKPESEYQKAAQANEGRMPWDPPVRQRSWEQKSAAAPTSPAPKIVADAPGGPAPVIFARASEPSGKDGEESPKSRISDNPFMRRDSKEGMSPRSPVQRPTDAYPVISTVERAEPVKPSPEKVKRQEHALGLARPAVMPSTSTLYHALNGPAPYSCPHPRPFPLPADPVGWIASATHQHVGRARQVAEWAAVQQKAEAPTRIGEATPPEAEAEVEPEEPTLTLTLIY
jgi:hypothetical protein